MSDLARCHIDVLVITVDQHFFFQPLAVVDVQLARLDPLPGVLQDVQTRFHSYCSDFAGQALEVARIWKSLHVEWRKVGPVLPYIIKFVVARRQGTEIEKPSFKKDLISKLLEYF